MVLISVQAINENDVNNIILSYLIHNCYKESSESFISCTGMKQPADHLENMEKRKSRFLLLYFSLKGGLKTFGCLWMSYFICLCTSNPAWLSLLRDLYHINMNIGLLDLNLKVDESIFALNATWNIYWFLTMLSEFVKYTVFLHSFELTYLVAFSWLFNISPLLSTCRGCWGLLPKSKLFVIGAYYR